MHSDPGTGTYHRQGALALCTIPSQPAISRWEWGFRTVLTRFDPGDHRFRSLVVGVLKVWKDFGTGDGTLSSSGGLALLLFQ